MPDFDLKLLPDNVVKATMKLIEIGKGDKVPPPLLFSGPAGTGKTSLAHELGKMLACEVLTIHMNNARETQSEKTVERFCSAISLNALERDGCTKMVIVDECDASVRNGEIWRPNIDRFKDRCAFIFITNHPDKLSTSLRSRLLEIKFDDGIDIRQMQLQQQLDGIL